LVEYFSISPRKYGRAAAYDHASTAILMSEMWLQEIDPLEKAKYEQAALKAASWSKDEPALRNHNYTAKNIWVLAQMYSLTGNANLRNALVEKLDKSLKPGVLMDVNSDGYVDGM
jgi:hypothetical protein